MTVHPEHAPVPHTPGRARGVASALAEIAPTVHGSMIALGLWLVVSTSWGTDLRADPRPILVAIARLGSLVLAGWVARRLLRAFAALLDLFADQAETIARLADAAERLAVAIERAPAPPGPAMHVPPAIDMASTPTSAPTAADDPRTSALAAIRTAIRQGQWDEAESLFMTFSDAYPDDQAAAGLSRDLDALRRSAVAAHRDRLDAARTANDPERIFEIRESLASLLDPEPLRELDRELAGWFLRQIQKRLRNGIMTPDVVALATRVADAFDATPEGASLRAALPTLRRSVGLCARCGKPYSGIADACPACLAASSVPTSTSLPVPPAGDGDGDGDGEVTQPGDQGFPEGDVREPE